VLCAAMPGEVSDHKCRREEWHFDTDSKLLTTDLLGPEDNPRT